MLVFECHKSLLCQKVPLDWSPEMRLETYRAMSRHVGDTVGSLGVCNFRSVVTRHALLRINC